MERLILAGRVRSGLGQGASFTQLAWARAQFMAEAGIDPFPGTLNLSLEGAGDLRAWQALKATPGYRLLPPEPGWCAARCYPVTVGGRFPATIVYPEVPGYPERQVEIVAALSLRTTLGLADGDELRAEVCQPLRVRAVLFDVDGTLLDSIEAYRVVAEQAAAPLGLVVREADVRRTLNTGESFWHTLVPAGMPEREAVIARLRAEAARCWPEVLAAHGRLCPDVRPALDALRLAGARLGLVTGARSATFDQLRAAGLLDYFEVLVAGGDVSRKKPDPEGLLKCAQALGVGPAEAVYVGDTIIDVQASRAAGMASVAVLAGAGDSASLSAAGPDRLISTLARLPEILSIG